MRIHLSRFASLFLLAIGVLLPAFASAQDFYWASGVAPNERYAAPEPLQTCKLWSKAQARPYYQADDAFKMTSPQGNQGTCSFRWYNGSVPMQDSLVISRRGAQCPSGAEFNVATGVCDRPAPGQGDSCTSDAAPLTAFGFVINSSGACVDYARADLASQCKNLGGTSLPHTIYVSFDGDGNPLTPPPITAGGCSAVAVGVSHCTMAPKRVFPTGGSIQPTGNKCKVMVSFTGAVAGSGNPLPVVGGPAGDGLCKGECEDLPPAPIANDSSPCNYVEDGEGRRVCSSNQYNYKPGQTSCGTVNGSFQCLGKAPTTTGVTIATTIKDTANADGGKTSVKTDKATAISCTGNAKCIGQTTTTTTTTYYNSNGARTGQSSSCVGPSCPPSGEGKGNCEPGQDCSQKEEEGFEGAELGEAAGFGQSLETFMSSVKGAPIIAGISKITVPTGGSCAFQPMVVPILGTLSLQPMCTWAADWFAPLRYLMLAIWAFVAVRTFMEA